MDDALAEIGAENPLTFIYGGTEYSGIIGDSIVAKSLGFGGFAPAADLVIVVRVAAVPAVPLKSEITVGGRVYLLDQYTEDPNGTLRVWALSDPDKGA